MPTETYPQTAGERDRWILSRRPPRNQVDPTRPYAFLVEEERAESGEIVSVATIFLTNRECPWRCLMCDLWRNTLTESVALGAIPAQIDFALSRLGSTARHVKLYNSGSFFDARAIPPGDHEVIAAQVCGFERVIVECHPALIGEPCVRFRNLLAKHSARLKFGVATARRLEIALGLETVHPEVLDRLNKRMTLGQFARAAEFLRQNEIALRVFILVKPPFLNESEGLDWAKKSLDFAMECGATVASLIPTRPGNGALEVLARRGEFAPPQLATLEAALDYGIALHQGRVFADLWDLERFADCAFCFPERRERLRKMNRQQDLRPDVRCAKCGAGHER